MVSGWLKKHVLTICAVLFLLLGWIAFERIDTPRGVATVPAIPSNTIIFPQLHKEHVLLKKVRSTEAYTAMAEVVQQQRKIQLALETPPTTLLKQKTDCLVQHCIALTFDDGPSKYTEQLLNILQERQAKATFFVLGVYVERFASVMKKMVYDGHQIGNHTWSHRNLTVLSPLEMSAEINQTNYVVQLVSGVIPSILRPPYGAINQEVLQTSNMPQILWSIDPNDWRQRDPSAVAAHIVSAAQRGDIVLLHDVYASSVEAVPAIVDGLRAKGLTFATIDELLPQKETTGVFYRQP